MKKMLTSARVLMLLLAGSAGAACAQSVVQSLGVPATPVWIGVPLDLSVPARFATRDVRPDCVQAEVFYGERRLLPHQVRTSLTGADPLRKRVRVEADVPIDEPLVTVSLRVGCAGALTRKYTLLPDIPPEQVLASLPTRPPAGPQSLAQQLRAASPEPEERVAARPTPRAGTASPARTAAAGTRVADRAAPRAQQERTAPPPAARARRNAAPVQAAPRLRLEPLELDSRADLRLSSALAQPAGDAGRRATAALLWQAINADPAERLRTTAQLQALERELAQVQQSVQRMGAEVEALRGRAGESQAWYASGAALQVLALLVLAAGAAAALAWLRARAAGAPLPWNPVPAPRPAAWADHAPEQEEMPAPEAPAVASIPAVAPPAALSQPEGRPRVETLAALFDEVEFLCALGLRADAIDALKGYLEHGASPAPVAYLELLRLCALEGDEHGLAAVRHRYEQVFGVQAPPLQRLLQPAGLDRLPALARRVTQAWHCEAAGAVLEEALFGVPDPVAPLTLQAARELLFLHALARRLAAADAAQAAGRGLAPWAHADDADAAHALLAVTIASPGAPVLDIDLDTLASAAEVEPVLTLASDEETEVGSLLAQMHAQAREAEERAAADRRRQEEEEAFALATAAERRIVRL